MMLVEFQVSRFEGVESRCYEVVNHGDRVTAIDVDVGCHVGTWIDMSGFWEFVTFYMRGTRIVIVKDDSE